MRRTVLAVPFVLAVAACSGGGWPSGSYAPLTEAEAQSLAPQVTSYLSGALPVRTEVMIVPGPDPDPLAPMLNVELRDVGLVQSRNGRKVRYVAVQMDNSIMLRVSIDDTQGMTRLFTHNTHGDLIPNGPAMVALP